MNIEHNLADADPRTPYLPRSSLILDANTIVSEGDPEYWESARNVAEYKGVITKR